MRPLILKPMKITEIKLNFSSVDLNTERLCGSLYSILVCYNSKKRQCDSVYIHALVSICVTYNSFNVTKCYNTDDR